MMLNRRRKAMGAGGQETCTSIVRSILGKISRSPPWSICPSGASACWKGCPPSPRCQHRRWLPPCSRRRGRRLTKSVFPASIFVRKTRSTTRGTTTCRETPQQTKNEQMLIRTAAKYISIPAWTDDMQTTRSESTQQQQQQQQQQQPRQQQQRKTTATTGRFERTSLPYKIEYKAAGEPLWFLTLLLLVRTFFSFSSRVRMIAALTWRVIALFSLNVGCSK